MREILFRGKTEKGEWVYGDLSIGTDGAPAIYERLTGAGYVCRAGRRVLPETVGQYTGLCESGKNGKKIFEGDVVKAQDDVFGSPFDTGIIGKIVYDECAFFIEPKNPMDSQRMYDECAVYEVLGNIHDNPELLKGADELCDNEAQNKKLDSSEISSIAKTALELDNTIKNNWLKSVLKGADDERN